MKKKDIYVTNKPLSEAREQWNQALQKIDFYDRDAVETIRVDDSIGPRRRRVTKRTSGKGTLF